MCVAWVQLRADRGHADWTSMTLYDMFQLLVVDEDHEAAQQGGGEGRRAAGREGERRGAS